MNSQKCKLWGTDIEKEVEEGEWDLELTFWLFILLILLSKQLKEIYELS